jgi:hypothetical protein
VKKLLNREKLQEFSDMLDDLCENWTTENIMIKIIEMQLYYDIQILEKPKEKLNEIKRKLYQNIKNATDEKTRQQWYELYQLTKEGNVEEKNT